MFKLKLLCTGFLSLGFAFAGTTRAAAPAGTFLRPNLQVGEHLSHVFSRAISIKGSGFKEIVDRVSGTDDSTVVAIDSKGIVLGEGYRYDGHPAGSDKIRIMAGGTTLCRAGRCAVDHETSGALFNPLLWGHAPGKLHVGETWNVTISEPWELGPPGDETVHVVRMDPASHTITLFREGRGSGLSLHDQSTGQVTIDADNGLALKVMVVPGESSWRGRTIVRDGIIVADSIMVKRHVTLVAASGRKFEGEQRAYTLENLLLDQPRPQRAGLVRPDR